MTDAQDKINILVVDDEFIIAKNLQHTLIDLGHVVLEVVCSAKAAIEKAEALKPNLIFMDIRLGSELDGIETARIIRERFDIPVVFLTAYADEETLTRSRDVAPYGYLVKPASERDIRIVVDIAIGRHRAEILLKKSQEEIRKANEELDMRVAARTLELGKLANDLAKEKLKLERSNKELEQFAGVAAHDLRAPLKSMHSWIDMLDLIAPKPRSEEIDQALDFIRLNAKKASVLIDDLLEVARVNVSNAHIENVDLNKVIGHLLEVMKQNIANSGAEVRCDILAELKSDLSLRRIPVCMFSNGDIEADVQESYDRGASFYFRKPAGLDKLRKFAEQFKGIWFDFASHCG